MEATRKRELTDAAAIVAVGVAAWAFDLPAGSLATALVAVFLAERRLHRALAQEPRLARTISGPDGIELELPVVSYEYGQRWARVGAVFGLAVLTFAVRMLEYGFGESMHSRILGVGRLIDPGAALEEPIRWLWWATAFQLAYALPLVAYLHIFRRAVRRHENARWRATMPPSEAEPRIAHASQSWSDRYATDTLLSLGALVPVLGWPAVVAVAVRPSGTLDLHSSHTVEPEPARSPA